MTHEQSKPSNNENKTSGSVCLKFSKISQVVTTFLEKIFYRYSFCICYTINGSKIFVIDGV